MEAVQIPLYLNVPIAIYEAFSLCLGKMHSIVGGIGEGRGRCSVNGWWQMFETDSPQQRHVLACYGRPKRTEDPTEANSLPANL